MKKISKKKNYSNYGTHVMIIGISSVFCCYLRHATNIVVILIVIQIK